MTPEDLDPGMREWLCAREIMRRLGFPADDLYFACQLAGLVIEDGVFADLGKPVIMLLLKTQNKEFSWIVGTVDTPADKVDQTYIDACELWNTSPDSGWRDRMYFASMAYAKKIDLVKILKQKGFSLANEIIN